MAPRYGRRSALYVGDRRHERRSFYPEVAHLFSKKGWHRALRDAGLFLFLLTFIHFCIILLLPLDSRVGLFRIEKLFFGLLPALPVDLPFSRIALIRDGLVCSNIQLIHANKHIPT